MVQVVWTRRALTELRAIHTYIAQFSPIAAQRLAQRVTFAARSLETSPDRGRPIRGGRRELVVVRPYIIRYVRLEGRVVIQQLRHGAQEPD